MKSPAYVRGAAVAVGAEVALVEIAVWKPRKGSAPFGHFQHAGWSFLNQQLDRPRVGEVVALLVGVDEVLFPAVFRVDGPERGIDAASSEDGVRVVAKAFAEDNNF